MLMKNLRVSSGLVNGARGRVVGFAKEGGWPKVKFLSCKDGEEVTLKAEKWTVKGAGGAVLYRKQLPLKLAWAFSIHKSQGMTLDCVEVNLTKAFESGQAYVALSRARSLETTRVVGFSRDCISADRRVARFYRDLVLMTPRRIGRDAD